MMRKIVTALFAIFLLSSVAAAQTKSRRVVKTRLAPTSAAPSASDAEIDRIFQRFADAQGDPFAMRLIHSMVMRGVVEIPEFGVHGSLEMYAKEPNKKLIVFNMPGRFGQRIAAYNGRGGWGQEPSVPAHDLKKKDSKGTDDENADLFNSRIFRKRYSKLTLKSNVTIDGHEYNVIEGTLIDGPLQTMYFDTQSGLMVRRDSVEKNEEKTEKWTTYFEGIAKIKGIVMPTLIREVGKEFSIITRFYEVKFNVYIDDTFFERPKGPDPEAKDESKTDEKK
jgi:hypothetical protein